MDWLIDANTAVVMFCEIDQFNPQPKPNPNNASSHRIYLNVYTAAWCSINSVINEEYVRLCWSKPVKRFNRVFFPGFRLSGSNRPKAPRVFFHKNVYSYTPGGFPITGLNGFFAIFCLSIMDHFI